MFFKLAFKNVRRSIKDYLVYFITLTLSVCIFYMFNSVDAQIVMLDVNEFSYASSVVIIIGVVSVFVAVVLAFLIVYANNFIMRRRKREIGLYMLLGFSARKTAGMLVIETLLIGVLAFAAGIGLGYLASQGMSVLTANMFGVAIRNYHFVFSPEALLKTLVYFGITFVIVMIFNAGTVARQPLAALLGAGNANERFRARRRWVSVLLTVSGIFLIAVSYWLVLGLGIAAFMTTFGPALLVNFVGTLFLFYGMSGFMLAAQKKAHKRSLRGLRIFSERQLLSRVNTNAVSMTFICTMIFLTLVIVSSVSSINTAMEASAATEAPVDVSLTAYQEGTMLPVGMLEDHLRANGVGMEMFSGYVEYTLYDTDVPQGAIADPTESLEESAAASYRERLLAAVAVSDFNRLAALVGIQQVDLPPGTYALDVPLEQDRKILSAVPGGTPISVGGHELVYWDGPAPAIALWTSSYATESIRLIVPDDVVGGLTPYLDVFCADYAVDREVGDQVMSSREGVLDNGFLMEAGTEVPMIRMAIASNVLAASRMSMTAVVFVGLYIGMIFLVAGAAILALQQLSGASDDRPRYELLSKLGASRAMIDRSLLTQMAVYFFLPLVIGAIHSVFGISFMVQTAGALGMDIVSGTVTAALLICVIYGGYFAATYLGARSIIRTKQVRQE